MLEKIIESDEFFSVKLPGVTTLLSELFGKDEFKEIPEAVLKQAADRGKAVHSYIEQFILTGNWPEIELAYQVYIDYFKEWYEKYKPKFITTEQKLVSKKLGYKGIIDTVFIYEDENGISHICMCDWKTSSNLNRFKTMCQLNLYALLFKEHYRNIKINEIRTVSITNTGWRFSKFELSNKISNEILHLIKLKRIYND